MRRLSFHLCGVFLLITIIRTFYEVNFCLLSGEKQIFIINYQVCNMETTGIYFSITRRMFCVTFCWKYVYIHNSYKYIFPRLMAFAIPVKDPYWPTYDTSINSTDNITTNAQALRNSQINTFPAKTTFDKILFNE